MPSGFVKQLVFLFCLSLLLPVPGHSAYFGGRTSVQQEQHRPIMKKPRYRSVDNLSSSQAGPKNGDRMVDEILVKFRASTADSTRNSIHKKHGSKRMKDFKKLNLHQVKLKKGLSVAAAIRLYQADPEVEYVEPNYLVSAAATPNDPLYGSSGSWGQPYQDLWGLHKMQLGLAWDVTQGSAEVVVAVSDTGLDMSHSDIQGNIWTNPRETAYNGIDDDSNSFTDDLHGWNFVSKNNNVTDNNGHGTHVSGTIAAATDNGTGVAGISWHAKIMPLKFLDAQGSGSTADGIATIVYAADNGARVVNCSWGSTNKSRSLEDAVNYAFERGVVVVAAAGNNAADAASFYPGGCENVITVAATDSNDEIAYFSNYGQAVEVAAPGVDILSLRAAGTDMYGDGSHVLGGSYYRASGTSMAAPHVSGLAALLLSQHPAWSGAQVMAQIIGSSDNVGNASLGTGRANAFSALTKAATVSRVQYRDHTMSPSSDGALHPGESFTIAVTVKNMAAPTGATVTLTCQDPYVTVTNGSATRADIPSYGVAVAPFLISVSPQAPKLHQVSFTVTVVASDGSTSYASFDKRVSPFVPGWPVEMGGDSESDPTLADMDGDGVPEVIIASDKIYVLKGDGTTMAGWPREAPPYLAWWSDGLAVGDLDGDGKPEIVGNNVDSIFAWKADGTTVPGFPLDLSAISEVGAGFINVALADIDGDGRLEIIAHANWPGKVYVWRHDGTIQPGWPVSTEQVQGAWNDMFAAVGDIDGDGLPEVLVPVADKNKVYAWHHDGTPVTGWPVSLAYPPDAVVIGDVKGDGRIKIFVATKDFQLYAFNSDGSGLPGWPQAGAAPSLGDIDGDGQMEVAADAGYTMRVYRNDGSMVAGWPREKISNSLKGPLLGDIDGDGSIEVVERTLWGIYAWHADGTPVADFPIRMGELPTEASVALGDIKGDGRISLLTGSATGDKSFYAFNLPAPAAQRNLIWPMQQRDAQRTGGMPLTLSIVPPFLSGYPGFPFMQQLVARDGAVPYQWQIVSGSLPAGLSLSSSGVISGAPLAAGSYSFTLEVRDAAGATASKACSFAVEYITVDTRELLPARVGLWYSQWLAATGSKPPFAWSIPGGGLPPGLSLDSATGTIAGYATVAGSFSFTARVTDVNGQQANQPLQIAVSEPQPEIDTRAGAYLALAVDKEGNLYSVAERYGTAGLHLAKTDSSGKVIWTRDFSGMSIRGVQVDGTGNVYVAGFNNFGTWEAFAIKYDPAGNLLWTRSNSGTLSGMAVDDTGNIYLAGFPQVRNGSDAWLIKYDPAGTVSWRVDDVTGDVPKGVAIDPAGGVYVSCSLGSVLKFTPSGARLWNRTYGSGTLQNSGIAADRDSNVLVASNSFLSKYSPSGSNLWQVALGGASLTRVVTDSTGNVFVTGAITTGSSDMITTRFDPSGNKVWSKTYDRGFTDTGNGLAVDESSNSVYAAGATSDGKTSYPVTVRYCQPKIATAALPEAKVNGPFSQTLLAERGVSPYLWSLQSSALPPGLSLDSATGVISGKPEGAGSYSFTVKVTDAKGISELKSLSLVVISSISETDFVAAPLSGQVPLLVQFTDTSTDSPVFWSWEFGDGATSSVRNAAHVYTVPGSYTVTMTAGNGSSTGSRTRTEYITLAACANAPVNLASLAFSSFTDPDSAYAQAVDNDLIMLQAFEFSGIHLDRDIRVTLKGGYDCGYADNPGASTLRGNLRVQNGSVKVEKLHFR